MVSSIRHGNPTPGAAPDVPPEARAHWRLAVVIVAVSAVVRLVLAAVVPLFPDETYYWEWSRSLAAGYFDHPPGIALFIAAGAALLGDTALGVRLFSVLGGSVAALAIALLARRIAGDRAALHAAAVLACLPLAATGLVLATPDAPLLTFGALGLLMVERALASAPGSAVSSRWWTLAGVALGAAFLSKYTAVLLPFGVVLSFLFHPELRKRFREPGPYLASALALAIFAPVVWWNATHEWASFRFQLGHGLGSGSGGSPILRVLELVGGQLLLATPVLFVLMAVAALRAMRGRHGDARQFMLAVVAATVLLFFAVSALRKPVEANWPAAAYLAAIPLLGAAAAAGRARRWMTAGYAIGGVLVLVVWMHALVPILPVSARKDPIARAHGWKILAAAADSTARSISLTADRVVHIGAERYQDASELAFHLPGQPFVPALNIASRPNQYGLWPQFRHAALAGDDLVFVIGESDEVHPAVQRLEPHFAEVQRGPLVELRRGDGVAARRRIWVMRGWRGEWP